MYWLGGMWLTHTRHTDMPDILDISDIPDIPDIFRHSERMF